MEAPEEVCADGSVNAPLPTPTEQMSSPVDATDPLGIHLAGHAADVHCRKT